MSAATSDCILFTGEALLPDAWRSFAAAGPVRTFNPGLLREGPEWILAYRIVAHDGLRRIALCRLDAEFRIVEGSAIPLSDGLRFRPGAAYPEIVTQWFADPRLYRFGERVFVYWNSGWHEPRNHQFLQELDPVTLRPIGVARELILNGERQKLEKNWTFFGTGPDEIRAVYSINPHRILACSLAGDGDVLCTEANGSEWLLEDYPPNHGGLRGGAPPCLSDGEYWSFAHTVHSGTNGYQYAAVAYSFAATAPFRPLRQPFRPLKFGSSVGDARRYPRLNPAVGEVIYPCGAARDGARWIISHGINDEYSALSIVSHASVLETLRPVPGSVATAGE